MSSAKKLKHRLSIRESRESSKLQRLLKFIQQNSPVKITHHIHTEGNNNSNNSSHINFCQQNPAITKRKRQSQQRNKQRKEAIKDNKALINQVVHSYLQKLTTTKFQNISQIKEKDQQKQKQLTKKLQIKNNLANNYDALPLIKIVKTQQTRIQTQKQRYKEKDKTKNKEKVKSQNQYKFRQLIEGKKYQSLLLLPQHIKSKNINKINSHQQNLKTVTKQNTLLKNIQHLIKQQQVNKNKNGYQQNGHEYQQYTGWQTTDKYLNQFQHTNLY